MKKLISIILVVIFSSQELLSAQGIGNNTMLAPESLFGGIGSKRDLYGLIETSVLRSCAESLFEKYDANGKIEPTDKEEEINRWIEIYKRIPNPVNPGKFNHYLRKLIRALKIQEEDGKIVFTGQIDRKRFRITKTGELSWERMEPVEFVENKGLSERGRLRKSGYAEVKDINDETAKYHELFHIAWWNKLKTDRRVIDNLVRDVSEGELSEVRRILGWNNIPAQRVLNEALARVWSSAGEDELAGVLPSGLLDKVIEVLGLEDLEAIRRLDSSYVESAIHMPCDWYYIAERNRRAEEERKKMEKDEKGRKKKEEEEKERVKRIKEKLEGMGKKLKDRVLDSDKLIDVYNANFEHDVRETIIKRLGWLGDRGKLKEAGFSVIDDLATALIEGIDEMGGLKQGEGRFNEGDRETLKQWLEEAGIDGLIGEMAQSDTFKPIKEEEEENIKKALETGTHEHGVMGFLKELAPDVFGDTLKSIIWVLITVGISYILSHIFGWEMGSLVLVMAPIVPTGTGTRDQAKFPSGSEEELKEPSDWIKKYTINLTEMAGEITAGSIYLQRKMGEIDRVFRQPEHNNLVLVGDPELANELVENTALEIARYRKEGREDRLPLSFQGAEILKFNVSAILGDLAQFGRYERTMRDLAREIVEAVKKDKRRYIFYFNFQDIAWIHDQRLDLVADISTLFKSILEEQGVPVIGIASEKYHQRFFVDRAENKDMQRYFSKVILEDLETADIQILLSKYIRQARERYKDILPPDADIRIDMEETLNRVLRIMNELFPGYNIPVTLLEIMDEVITEKVYRLYNVGLYCENLFNRMVKVMEELRDAKQKGNKGLEGFLRGLLIGYNKEWEGLEGLEREVKSKEIDITFQDIAEKISIRKRIPVSQLVQEKEKKLDGLVDALRGRIVGQDFAISEIYRKFKEKQHGLSDKRLPFGAFVFLGPTGVGKTEVVRALADYYFDARMVRIDMSEYMEPYSVEKIFGAPPGRVGYEQGGILTNAVRENPFSLVLLDEIDKAHPEVFQVLNQILGEGKCTDGQGREINFSNTIIIMTGNVGMQGDENPELVRLLADIRCRIDEGGDEDKLAEDLKKLVEEKQEKIEGLTWIINRLELYKDLGQTINNVTQEIVNELQGDIEKRLEDALEIAFRGREIMGRVRALGGVISFNGLTRKDMEDILDMRLREINEWLMPYNIGLDLSRGVRDIVIKEGYNPVMGARPLARAIRRLITAPLADAILYNTIKTGRRINVELDGDGKIGFIKGEELIPEVKKGEETLPPGLEELTGKGDIEDGLRKIYNYQSVKTEPKGAIKLDEERLRIEIPVDMDEIKREADGLSQQRGADVAQLIQEMTGQKKKFEKWVNDKFDSLTIKAKRKELPRAFSEPEVFNRFINVLNQKKRNNPFLIGEDTRLRDSLIEYFAVQALNSQIPGYENARLLRLNINEVIEYMPGIGMLEECMRRLIKNIEEDDERKGLRTYIVIDYDELERTVTRYRRKIDEREELFNLGFFMIPFVNSKVRLIMSSSNKRVQEYEVFHRYFNGVGLQPMDSIETKEAFWLYIKDALEKQINGSGQKRVEVDYEILDRIITLFEKYLPGEPLMETLLDFLKRILPEKGEKGVEKERRIYGLIKEIEERLNFLRSTGKIDRDSLRRDERLLEFTRNVIRLNSETGKGDSMSITEEDVIGYLVNVRNVSLERIGVDEFDKLRRLEGNLKARVLYQGEHIDRIIRSVKTGALGFKRKNQPVSTLMFNGPTGCGKTETARALADSLGYNFISINLSRIKRIAHLSTLIGPPPGYIGYGKDVEEYLTTKVIKNPKSVIIFDEADKALNTWIYEYEGRSLIDILLPIFEDGRLTDSIGQTADFSQCIVIIASNGGINEVYDPQRGIFIPNNEIYRDIGELTKARDEEIDEKYTELRKKMAIRVFNYLRRKMRPEMLNRIDENIVFNPLTRDALKGIIRKQINEFIERVRAEHNYEIQYDGDVTEDRIITYLLYSHFIPEEGARSLTEPIKKNFMGPVMDFVIGKTGSGRAKILRRIKIGFNNKTRNITITEEEARAEEEEVMLTEEEARVINNITNGLKEKGKNEPVLDEELEEWLGIRPLISEREAVPSPFTDNAVIIKADTNDFWTRGKEKKLTPGEVKKVIDGLDAKLGDSSLVDIVFNWLLSSIEIARRMNIEKVMSEKGVSESGLNLDKPKLAGGLYSGYIEETDKKYGLEFIWEEGEREIRLGVRFDTGITRMVYRLLSKQWKDDREIYNFCSNNRLMGLYPLLSWTNKLKDSGMGIDISLDNGRTILWVKPETQRTQRETTEGTEEKPQSTPSPQLGRGLGEGAWQKIAEDEEKIGKGVERIAIDPDNNYIYAATWDKKTIAIIRPDGEIETIPVGQNTEACAVTKEHIFVATEKGIYVYKKDTKKLDKSIGKRGIIGKGILFAGVAVREKDSGYEVFGNAWKNDKILKYTSNNNYSTPKELGLKEPRGLTFNSEGKLLAAYRINICIIDPDTMKIEYDSGDMGKAELNGPNQAVEKDGDIYVTGCDSQKTLAFRRSDEWLNKKKGIKRLVRVGELKNPSAIRPVGIGIRGDELIIACQGEVGGLSNIWAVGTTEGTEKKTQSTQKKQGAKVIGECLSKYEAEQIKGAIRGAEDKEEVFDLYPQADRYGEELDKVLRFLSTGPIKYQKFGRFLEEERVYIKVVSSKSNLFQGGNTGFVVEDENGNRREVYAFSMFNPEDNPDGPIYATIYIPEPVILKANEYDFLEGFAVDLVHELVEIEDIRRRGLAGEILDGDMDKEAHGLAEKAELDFGEVKGVSTLDLFLTQPEPDIDSIKRATEEAVGRYRDKGLIEYTTMPERLIQIDIPQHEGQVGIILDSSLILNEIGMRECLEKLAKVSAGSGKPGYIVWVMAKDEKEKAVLKRMQLPKQEVFVNEELSRLIRCLKGKVGAGNVGIGLGPLESTGISEEIRELAKEAKVPIVVPELPKEGQIVSTPMVITGILNAISTPPDGDNWIILLPPIKLPGELWQKLLDEYRSAVELEFSA